MSLARISPGCLVFGLVVCLVNVFILRSCSPSHEAAAPPIATGGNHRSLARRLMSSLLSAAAKSGAEPPLDPRPRQTGPDPTALYTQQTCYLDSDESELCAYENALCWDGEGPVVVVADPIREPRRVLDYTHECLDVRFYEPSSLEYSNCHWAFSFQRGYTEEDVTGRLNADHSLPLGFRRWGPLNRGVAGIFREVAAWEVYGSEPPLPAPPGQRGTRGGAGQGAGIADDGFDDGFSSSDGVAARSRDGKLRKRLASGLHDDDGDGSGLLSALIGSWTGGGSEGGVDAPPTWRARQSGLLGSTTTVATDVHRELTAHELLEAIDGAEPFAHPSAPGAALRARYSFTTQAPAHAGRVLPSDVNGADPEATAALKKPPAPYNVTVEWLDGAMWLTAIGGQYEENPFHWWSKIGMLWQAQRNNATRGFGDHPADGWVHWQADSDIAVAPSIRRLPGEGAPGRSRSGKPRMRRAGSEGARSRSRYVQGSQWGPLAPMDNVLIVGDHDMQDRDRLGSWFNGTLGMAVQAGTSKVHFRQLTRQYSPEKLLCARRGVVVGTKYRFFSGRADGNVFRNYAYKLADVRAPERPAIQAAREGEGAPMPTQRPGLLGSSPHFPPRQITLLNRPGSNGRAIQNLDEVLDACRATGVEVEVVSELGGMSFSEQIALMSRTGILISPHGAALANAVFLPARSVAIELFPYSLKKTTYSNILAQMDVHYFPVYSETRLAPDTEEVGAADILYSRYYHERCVSVNISAYDGVAEHACNQATKLHPVIVDMEIFRYTLRHAVDSIGAFSLLNPWWEAEAKEKGLRPPTYEEWTAGRAQWLIDRQGDPQSSDGQGG